MQSSTMMNASNYMSVGPNNPSQLYKLLASLRKANSLGTGLAIHLHLRDKRGVRHHISSTYNAVVSSLARKFQNHSHLLQRKPMTMVNSRPQVTLLKIAW